MPEHPTGEVVHYVPHHPVVKETAETTRLRIVYDCSAKATDDVPSLNECLETGPTLQPKLFNILLRNRFNRYIVTGDIQKAFLQIYLDELDKNAQRILWYDDLKGRNISEFRFSRVIFGATPSPYILGATIEKHLEIYRDVFPETVRMLQEDTYVDDIQGEGRAQAIFQNFKEKQQKLWSVVALCSTSGTLMYLG